MTENIMTRIATRILTISLAFTFFGCADADDFGIEFETADEALEEIEAAQQVLDDADGAIGACLDE
ncbi:MAG: hypothetical protein ACI9WU_004271, partial [Myxococcota bacterium]